MPSLSIVIPALDEAGVLPALLGDLRSLRGPGCEIIVVDGGSRDGTAQIAAAGADRVLGAARGRSAQLNAGAARARGAVLLFLHADSRVSPQCAREIARLVPGAGWGFFRIRLEGRSRWLPLVSRLMFLRARLSGIATGDQGLFVARELFRAVGGFPGQPLMEDVEICRRLRARGRPRVLPATLVSSGRRWDRDGAVRTILLMWWLRLRYALGADPAMLHRAYYGS